MFLRFKCILLLIYNYAYALPEDKQEIIHFKAGEIEWSQTQHQTILSRQVYFKQGSTRLYADHGKTEGNTNHQFIKVMLFGSKDKQSHFITIPKSKDPKVHAYANQMIYFPQDKMIELFGKVKIVQGRYRLEAPYLKYDLKQKKVISKGEMNQPTTVTIDPKLS